jgi:hypothetical protein
MRSKRRGTPMCRRTRTASTSAWSVLPVAINAEENNAPSTVTLAAKLPAQIAGHSRPPPSSTAASAMPEGGQIALA